MDNRIDTQSVNQSADLLSLAALAGSTLKRVASTGGGEYGGPCPFCGGRDRFRVEPSQHRWLCRQCTGGKWEDAISLGRRLWPGDNFRAVCERLQGGSLPISTHAPAKREPMPAAMPPSQEWQQDAIAQVEAWERLLWQADGARALDYLHKRGLRDQTIKYFRLGFRPEPRGISIPCFSNNAIWYVKFRQPVGIPKYILLKGSKPAAIFNADNLPGADIALFVEGEFDAMLCHQEFADLVPTATLGSATNQPDLAVWGRFFLAPSKTFILPDNDEAGAKGAETLNRYSRYPVELALSDAGCKDVTDFWKAGGDLRVWMLNNLQFHDPLTGDGSLLELAAAMGGAIDGK